MEGNQIKQRPPGMDQFVWQLLGRKILVIGLGRDMGQFYQALCDRKYRQISIGSQPDTQQMYQQFLDQMPNQNVGLLLFLQKKFSHEMERLRRQEKMRCVSLKKHDAVCLVMGTEQDLREATEGQSYELWEVKQEPGQGIVLQHQASLLEPPKQALKHAQKPKQQHVREQKRPYV